MSTCSKYNQSFLTACLNGDPGVSRVYIANYDDILSFTTDSVSGIVLSGLTCTGETSPQKCFYRVELLQDVGAAVDTPTISVANGVAISIPSVKFKISKLTQEALNAFNKLKSSRSVVVYENMEGVLYAVGIQRGLYMTAGTAGTDEATFEGITVELKGKEPIGQYIFSTSLQSTFVSTYVIATTGLSPFNGGGGDTSPL